MRVISVTGLLGAGKSSCILAALRELERRGIPGGVIVNDQGEVDLEAELDGRIPVDTIGGG